MAGKKSQIEFEGRKSCQRECRVGVARAKKLLRWGKESYCGPKGGTLPAGGELRGGPAEGRGPAIIKGRLRPIGHEKEDDQRSHSGKKGLREKRGLLTKESTDSTEGGRRGKLIPKTARVG